MYLTSVSVETRAGESTYARCGATLLENGDLQIISLDSGVAIGAHIAGMWSRADDGRREILAPVPVVPMFPRKDVA